jgi:hypothetical protein
MTRYEMVILPWECTLGRKSHLNLAGKILMFPLIALLAWTISIIEFLFMNNE